MRSILAPRPVDLVPSALALIVLTVSVAYLRSIFKWWYEDDPLQFHYAAQIACPWDIFTDSSTLRGFGSGHALVPMQLLSYWLDGKFARYSPLVAYLHSLLSLLATTLLFYTLLAHRLADRAVSFAVVVLWVLLPSTLVVHQFLATRHYMEGLLFALAAALVVEKSSAAWRSRWGQIWHLAAGLLLAAISMLYKEIFAAIVPVYLLLAGLLRRRPIYVLFSMVLVALYALYRLWLLGPSLAYTMPFLGMADYMRSLAVFPFTFSANWGGYIIYAGIGFLALLSVIRPRGDSRRVAISMVLLTAAAFVAIYPVAYAILHAYSLPRPWYRVPFVIHTLMLAWAGYLTTVYVSRRQQLACLVIILVVVLPGTHWTQQLWNERMVRAELEGRFYIENPDKLLLSEEEAFWYILGVHQMYGVAREHYINVQSTATPHARQVARQYPTIWRYANGHFAPDDGLHRSIAQETPERESTRLP
jgi:hypothetical protein